MLANFCRRAVFGMAMLLPLGMLTMSATQAEEDKTGTDPRGFSSKFMPYYLHTELENDVEVDQLNLFGMWAINPKFAMTYDLPVAQEIDYSDVDQFQAMSTAGNFPVASDINPSGLGIDDLSRGGDVSGIGDLGLRFFFKPDSTQFENSSHMFGAEVTLPTASKDVLGSETYILSPMYVYVRNIKLLSPGFIAFMNFYDTDIGKSDDDRPDVSRFRGRWFLMQPLTRPGPKLTDGLYLLPELQPVYDFENDEFSLWVAPEFGKLVKKGAVYFKPGFGVENDQDADRDWTLELGFRYFF